VGLLSIPKSRDCAIVRYQIPGFRDWKSINIIVEIHTLLKNVKYGNAVAAGFYKSCVDYNRKSAIRIRKGPTNELRDYVSMRRCVVFSFCRV